MKNTPNCGAYNSKHNKTPRHSCYDGIATETFVQHINFMLKYFIVFGILNTYIYNKIFIYFKQYINVLKTLPVCVNK